MIKFPSVEQFRTAIKNVSDTARWAGRDGNGDPIFNRDLPLPKIKYRGSAKGHGTNASVVLDTETNELTYQSRERVLSLTQDNAGFMLWAMSKEAIFRDIFSSLPKAKKVIIYGEWAGQGIQKGVAISQVPKFFAIFAIKLRNSDEDSRWLDIEHYGFLTRPEDRIFNVFEFGKWEIEIDFNVPSLVQNDLIRMTEEVEAECPIGKYFGVSGIGEGIVFTPDPSETQWWALGSRAWHKTKGALHSVSKVKTLVPVDVEAVKALSEFIESVVTEARLEQGIQNLVNEQLLPLEMTSLGPFLRWVYNDIMKEEMDIIVASQFDPKKLGSPIANKARPWYINRINSQ